MLLETIRQILVELLDAQAEDIRPESYLVRDLGVESIDFLELAVALNGRFRIDVEDDVVFLRNLRLHLTEAGQGGADPLLYLQDCYTFLPRGRLTEILGDLAGGPVLKVKDLVSYVQWRLGASVAA